jgi:hypothetical protein
MTREIQYAPLFHKYGVVTLIFAAATLGTLMCPSHHWAQEQTHNPEKLSADPDAPGSEHEQEDALFPLQREIWFQQ